MSARAGCALIGCGAWGSLVAAELVRAEGLALLGVADDVHERARSLAERLAVEAFASVEAALADARVTAVVVATPNDLHASLALAALDAGKNVLLEKPMALTVADAEAVDEAARARGLVLAVDHIQRYYEPLAQVKRLVDDGVLGEVQSAAIARRDFLERTTPWLQQRRRVGGLLYQSGCHEFDFLRWVCGEVVEIACLAAPRVIAHDSLDYPDTIVSQLRFVSGAIGHVWDCMTDPLMGYDCTITGTEGSAFVDLYDARLRWRRIDGEAKERTWTPRDRWAPWAWIAGGGIADGESEALRGLLSDFGRALAGEAPPPASGEDGARVVELAQAGYLSIVEGRPVGLPLGDADRARPTYLELPDPVAETTP